MTTDAAVADPVEETPTLVTGTEGLPDVPDNATPVGDADLGASSDAAPAPATDLASIEAEADAWLKEQEGKGSEPQAPEPEQRRGVDPAVAAEAINRFKNGYGTRQQRLDALGKKLTDAGYSQLEVESVVKDAKDILNEHHADALQYAGYEAAMTERRYLVDAIASTVPQSIQGKVLESLKPAEGQPNPPIDKVLKAFLDATAADAEARGRREGRKEGFIAGRSQGERTQSSARSGQQVQGDPASGARYYSQMTAEERNKLTPAQRDAEVARERQARGV